ncbi:MAG TPA: DNA repair protein RadC [Terriglobia bacterium]|nr:DNA repair protein RadC [Terriglobia bacterium]
MKSSLDKYTDPAGHRKRLRERFLKAGQTSLPDYELLELLLTYAIPRADTKPIAKAILDKFGSFINALQQPSERLAEIKGVGRNTVSLLRVVRACLIRCMEMEVEKQSSISGPEDVFAFVRMHLGSHAKECIYVFYLNETRQIVHHAEIVAGTVDRAPFYPREILKPAMLYNATGLILVHNHPEGQPAPSDQDFEMTRKLEDIAALLGIKLLDHLIVTPQQAYSIKTGKLL